MLNYEFLPIVLNEAGETGNRRFHNSEFMIVLQILTGTPCVRRYSFRLRMVCVS